MALEITDATATVTVHCDKCSQSWDEDMIELATGYDSAWGFDLPERCPNCARKA